ncbi:MAG: hypothetical protein HY209_01175 [Candidatus Omnitrophica bacterium]|nr:hypothetical protein [Candidatus Omnitrophota bacterium]
MFKARHNRIRNFPQPSRTLEGFLFVLAFAVGIAYADQLPPGIKIVAYHIQPLAFKAYEDVSDITKIPIVFSKYGQEAKLVYPAPKENTIRETSVIMKKCREALSRNVERIVKTQKENKAVHDYLTLKDKVPALNKEDFLRIVDDPREATFQRDPATNKAVAEFRSKEFPINKNMAFCIYITFICSYEQSTVEKIILSAVKLES